MRKATKDVIDNLLSQTRAELREIDQSIKKKEDVILQESNALRQAKLKEQELKGIEQDLLNII